LCFSFLGDFRYIRYNAGQLEAKTTAEFVDAMQEYGRMRRRDRAYCWGIFRDTEVADRYLETFTVDSWAEHLSQHERHRPIVNWKGEYCLTGESSGLDLHVRDRNIAKEHPRPFCRKHTAVLDCASEIPEDDVPGEYLDEESELNLCYYLLLFSVMMRRFWAAVGFVGLR
jgi:hypothetical protein